MKPGYKTTEFWLSFAAMVLGALMASGLLAEGSGAERAVGGVMAILATMGYTASRTQTKKIPPAPPASAPAAPGEGPALPL